MSSPVCSLSLTGETTQTFWFINKLELQTVLLKTECILKFYYQKQTCTENIRDVKAYIHLVRMHLDTFRGHGALQEFNNL